MKKDFSKQDFYDKLRPNGTCLEWSGGLSYGYGRTSAWGKEWLTHRLALELEGIDTTGHCVLHSCDNPACCNPAHLRLGTHAENSADMTVRNRQNRGKDRPAAKLTDQDVLDIRASTSMSQRAIAAQYGVSQMAICYIINRKTWRHV